LVSIPDRSPSPEEKGEPVMKQEEKTKEKTHAHPSSQTHEGGEVFAGFIERPTTSNHS
jgi:hypothetical protein